jgi:hypothetical protein
MTIQRPTLPSTAIPVEVPADADDAAHHDRSSQPSGSGVLQATGRLRGLPARDPGAFAQPRQAAASGPSSSSAAQPTFRLLPAHRFKAPAPPRPKLPFDRERALHFFPELTRYLDEVEFAYLMNETADTHDIDFLPELIEGLNAADPALKLETHVWMPEERNWAPHSSLTYSIEQRLGSNAAWRAVIEDDDHRLAMSVRQRGCDVSILMVDSLGYDKEDYVKFSKATVNALASMTASLEQRVGPQAGPVRIHLAVAYADTQKTLEGCAIFALSAARKMASEPLVRMLHERLLDGLNDRKIRPGLTRIDAASHLPPGFFKHTTSRSVVRDFLDVKRTRFQKAMSSEPVGWAMPPVDPDAPVNKKGQRLDQRYAEHFIERPDAEGIVRTFSNSYEMKRILLIREALTHLVARAEAGGGTGAGASGDGGPPKRQRIE